MDTFTMTTAAVSEETLREIIDRKNDEIDVLKNQVAIAQRNHESATGQLRELRQKIANVQGHMFDIYSVEGSVSEEIINIAHLLDITLLKEISGTATSEISWTAQVPLDFDANDMEISFSVECDTYEAEDFDYNEDSCDVTGEDV
jgi:hypothetical protein